MKKGFAGPPFKNIAGEEMIAVVIRKAEVEESRRALQSK